MAASHSFAGLMATRLLLGTSEASVAPTCIAVVQIWYRRREQTTRNAAWYAVLGVFGSLLTFGLGHIRSSLHPYQVTFLFWGAITVAYSFVNKEDKLIAIDRLRMNQMDMSPGVWKWEHVQECLLGPKTLLCGGISTFAPLIIASFSFDRFTNVLFNIPFGAVQMIATLGGAWLANRVGEKFSPILRAIGREPTDRSVFLTGYYIISFYAGISPLIYSWSGQNTAGDTAGDLISPFLFRLSVMPYHSRGLTANLALFVSLAILVCPGTLWIKILNACQAAKRKYEHFGHHDENVMNNAHGEARVGSKAFEDITDLENEDFICVY
ncbi:hypothetical protein NLU13_7955 [Sarocladium strictum]|uniref:Uncharacterized protein n=1 Tax=Sarocladium strictum TaxID=5046 RepID=A0AA39GBV3_SARSR|nr:hypothetical protein NLU13_7955 [Sarocladium strictum]